MIFNEVLTFFYRSAIHIACFKENPDIVSALLSFPGIDPNLYSILN